MGTATPAEKLKALREGRNLTQEQLAFRAAVTTKTIANIESGRHSGRRGTLRLLALALGEDPDYFEEQVAA